MTPGDAAAAPTEVPVRKILAFAHGCRPDRGSEDGAGWMWVRAMARLGEVTVITRADNREPIERALPATPERDRLRFVYLPPPRLAPRWRPDARGKRAFYLLWQRKALRKARELCARERPDLVWHVTWSNVWIGSVGSLLDIPFVFGPVGGGVAPPWRLLPSLGAKGAVYELVRAAVRGIGRYANPLARASWRRAELLLVSTEDMFGYLPPAERAKARLLPQAMVDGTAATPRARDTTVTPPRGVRPPTALLCGRLLALKGGALAVRAIRDAPSWRLVVCGDGPDGPRLQRLARRCGVLDRIEFRGTITRDEVQEVMRAEADVLLFPSLHDESPATVVEAALCGLPVICLAHGGGAVLAGPGAHIVDASGSSTRVVARLTAALGVVEAGLGAPRVIDEAHLRTLSLESRVEALRPALEHLGESRAAAVGTR